jgi:hypothetical protein
MCYYVKIYCHVKLVENNVDAPIGPAFERENDINKQRII